MGLEIKFKGSINRDATEIYFEDVTGADNNAGSSKYSTGSTNLNKAVADNQITEYYITLPNGEEKLLFTNISITSVVPNIPSAGFTTVPNAGNILTLLANNINIPELVFSEGVFIITAKVWFLAKNAFGNTGTTTYNASQNALAGVGTGYLSLKSFGDTSLVKIIKQSDSTKVVDNIVLKNTNATDTFLNLQFPLNSTDFQNGDQLIIYAGHTSKFYVKNDVQFMNCFLPKIAKISVAKENCCKSCGQSKIDSLHKLLMGIFSVNAQLDIGMLEEANKNLIALGKECRYLDCIC
jgi:hypothetical protein